MCAASREVAPDFAPSKHAVAVNDLNEDGGSVVHDSEGCLYRRGNRRHDRAHDHFLEVNNIFCPLTRVRGAQEVGAFFRDHRRWSTGVA